MESRGLAFVRYADDITVYAKSPRSAERNYERLVSWIEKHLKLRINREKSGIRPPDKVLSNGQVRYKARVLGRLLRERDGTGCARAAGGSTTDSATCAWLVTGRPLRSPISNPARLRLLRTRMRKHSRSRPEGAPGRHEGVPYIRPNSAKPYVRARRRRRRKPCRGDPCGRPSRIQHGFGCFVRECGSILDRARRARRDATRASPTFARTAPNRTSALDDVGDESRVGATLAVAHLESSTASVASYENAEAFSIAPGGRAGTPRGRPLHLKQCDVAARKASGYQRARMARGRAVAPEPGGSYNPSPALV